MPLGAIYTFVAYHGLDLWVVWVNENPQTDLASSVPWDL